MQGTMDAGDDAVRGMLHDALQCELLMEAALIIRSAPGYFQDECRETPR